MRGSGQTKLKCNTPWVMLTCLQVCKQGGETITNPHKKRSVDWHGLIIRLCGYSGNANANYLNTFQLEKGNSKENVDKLIFNCVNSIYIKKVYII